jgi:nuclear pore complex protein Nup93
MTNHVLVSFTTRQKPQINFGRMIGYYTRDFRASKPEAATDYLTLICLNADLPGASGTSQAALCHEALRELVLETREFGLLLGDIQSNGQRIKGAIEKRLPLVQLDNEEEFLRTVTKQAASIADDCGRVTDSVLLYHLAGEYDTVMTILNRCLSDAIALELGQGFGSLEPLKPRVEDGKQPVDLSLSIASLSDPVALARTMVDLYNSHPMFHEKVAQGNKSTCVMLLDMAKMKTLTEMGKYADALDVSIALPMTTKQVSDTDVSPGDQGSRSRPDPTGWEPAGHSKHGSKHEPATSRGVTKHGQPADMHVDLLWQASRVPTFVRFR